MNDLTLSPSIDNLSNSFVTCFSKRILISLKQAIKSPFPLVERHAFYSSFQSRKPINGMHTAFLYFLVFQDIIFKVLYPSMDHYHEQSLLAGCFSSMLWQGKKKTLGLQSPTVYYQTLIIVRTWAKYMASKSERWWRGLQLTLKSSWVDVPTNSQYLGCCTTASGVLLLHTEHLFS